MEICEYFGISTRHFDRLRARGEIPPPDVRLGDTKMWSSEIVSRIGRVDPDRPSHRRDHGKARTAATKA
jgi:hypothetical protein